jgi:hypothetical protein
VWFSYGYFFYCLIPPLFSPVLHPPKFKTRGGGKSLGGKTAEAWMLEDLMMAVVA